MAVWRVSFAIVLMICSAVPSRAAILVDSGDQKPKSESRRVFKTADDGRTLRTLRRVGVGLSGAGALGMGGVNFDLNFTPDVGILTGFGGGSRFQAISIQFKKMLGGTSLLPYLSGGYARWYNFAEPGRPILDTTPSFLGGKFLNDTEKREGRIAENLIFPALGIQYVQLSGPYAGSSLFAEILVLIDIDDFVAAPTGTLGYIYYF